VGLVRPGILVMCVAALDACGFARLDGLAGGGQLQGKTDAEAPEVDGAGDEPAADSSAGVGDGGGEDGSADVGSDGRGSDGGEDSRDATDAGEAGEPDGSIDAADAAPSDGGVNDAGKILALTVYDTGIDPRTGLPNSTYWSIMTSFTGAAPVWPPPWEKSYVLSTCVTAGPCWSDPGAPPLLGKPWIQTHTESKKYNPDAGLRALAKFTLGGTANVYLIVDRRAESYVSPSADGWSNTGYHMDIWETATRSFPFDIWVKLNQTGDVLLPIQGFNNAYLYFVIVD
jgi:hypothetical protein